MLEHLYLRKDPILLFWTIFYKHNEISLLFSWNQQGPEPSNKTQLKHPDWNRLYLVGGLPSIAQVTPDSPDRMVQCWLLLTYGAAHSCPIAMDHQGQSWLCGIYIVSIWMMWHWSDPEVLELPESCPVAAEFQLGLWTCKKVVILASELPTAPSPSPYLYTLNIMLFRPF